MKVLRKKRFSNGVVYGIELQDGYPIEVTDTFLPIETKGCDYSSEGVGDRSERWMIGISCMSGCPIGCKFCATGQLKRWRNLTHLEIFEQFKFIIDKNPDFGFSEAMEGKVNYTRMGEPFLNIDNIKKTINSINLVYENTHHYVSTVGIKGSDFSWVEGNITLQISVHSLNDERRRELIPLGKKLMTLKELGQIRTKSNLKTTVNLSLVDQQDFDIKKLKECFDPEHFFIKLSPINENSISSKNNLGKGVIDGNNY